VLVKEAQDIRDWEPLAEYLEHPQPQTLLVFCYRHKKMDKRTKVYKAISAKGIVYEKDKMRDYEVPDWIARVVSQQGYQITQKGAVLIAESLGNDLGKIANELSKVYISLPKGSVINEEVIETNIGISKDYNNFELEDALRRRDALKAYRIIDYFEKNPKNNPVQNTVGMLFSFFSNVLIVRATKDQSPSSLMAATGNKSSWRIEKFCAAARNFSTQACVNIITYLRECDVKSKGMGSHQDSYALLRELIYKILHA